MTLAELLADLGGGVARDAFVRPRRSAHDDARGAPSAAEAGLSVLEGFPEWIGDLGQLSGPPGRLDYRGGHRATIRVLDVTALGLQDSGAFATAAGERGAISDRDADRDLVSVTLDEGEGDDRYVIVSGRASGAWALVVTSDALETATSVGAVASDVILASG